MKHFSLGLAVLGILSSCTIYKSSDRDDFNEHGSANKPATSKPTNEHELCVSIADLTPEEKSTIIKTETGTIAKFADGSLHTVCEEKSAP